MNFGQKEKWRERDNDDSENEHNLEINFDKKKES